MRSRIEELNVMMKSKANLNAPIETLPTELMGRVNPGTI